LPLLNYYDQIGLTVRRGDDRYLKESEFKKRSP